MGRGGNEDGWCSSMEMGSLVTDGYVGSINIIPILNYTLVIMEVKRTGNVK